MDFLKISPQTLAELAAIPDVQPEVPAGSAPRFRDFLDEDQWFTAFDKWAELDKSLIDSLDCNDLHEVTQAVSHIELNSELEVAQLALNNSRSNSAAIEHFDHMLTILATERDNISEHLNRYLDKWVVTSLTLVDEYALMNIAVKKVTTDPFITASMMTWYDWPRGFNYLLRINAVHFRTSAYLSDVRKLCLEDRLSLSQTLAYPLHLLNPRPVPSEYGYCHYPNLNGFAGFHPPTTHLEEAAAYYYMTYSISLHDTRRRTAMARLARGTAGVSDFLIPNHADIWLRGARAWLNKAIPEMRSACALKWAQVSNDLEIYAEKWHKEAEYESNRVLVERYATYTLTRDRIVTFEYNMGDPVPYFISRFISLDSDES